MEEQMTELLDNHTGLQKKKKNSQSNPQLDLIGVESVLLGNVHAV